MGKIAIMTDSNSGITQKEAKELGMYVLPMPFYIDGKLYYEDIDLTQEQFYGFLENDAEVSTSQPSPNDVTDAWDKILQEYDSIIYMPMSSGLSGSCQTAFMLASDEPYEGKVFVIDNQRISVTMRHAIDDTKEMIKNGCSAEEIRDSLMNNKMNSTIYIMVDTLKYLKKGGRVTPAAAMLGTVLKLKPVLQIQGEKLDAYAKVRGQKQAKKTMIEAIRKDLENRFPEDRKNGTLELAIAHTRNEAEAMIFKKELNDAFPDIPLVHINPLSLSVSCHIGPGALAVAMSRHETVYVK